MTNEWTYNDFTAYLLLYAAQSNFIESKEEEEYILSKIEEKTYNKIHTEIVHDSDYDSVKKIEDYLQINNVSNTQKEQLIRDVKNVFFADGTVDKYESNVFQILKKLLK